MAEHRGTDGWRAMIGAAALSLASLCGCAGSGAGAAEAELSAATEACGAAFEAGRFAPQPYGGWARCVTAARRRYADAVPGANDDIDALYAAELVAAADRLDAGQIDRAAFDVLIAERATALVDRRRGRKVDGH